MHNNDLESQGSLQDSEKHDDFIKKFGINNKDTKFEKETCSLNGNQAFTFNDNREDY